MTADPLLPVREWLSAAGATHVVVDPARDRRRDVSVHTALVKLRRLNPISSRVIDDVATVTAVDRVSRSVRIVATLSDPEVRPPSRPVGAPRRSDRR